MESSILQLIGEKKETERMKQLILSLNIMFYSFKSRQLIKSQNFLAHEQHPHKACFTACGGPFPALDINTHNLYYNISSYNCTSLQGSPSTRDLCLCECVCVTVHACVTLCVGGCTCVFIKKYQLFWSVVHHSSHSPLACAHLAWPQEKKRGKVCDRRRSD